MVQLGFSITTGLVTLLAFLSKANALPTAGLNLNNQQLYLVCPLEETGRGDTSTCCTKMKDSKILGQGANINCRIPAVNLLADIPGIVDYLSCCSSSAKQCGEESCDTDEEDP